MEEITCGKTFAYLNNSISNTEKSSKLPSMVQSRGLPAMAPVYRIPKDRKRFTYLSYYPNENKPTNSYSLGVEKPTRRFSSNIQRLPPVTQKFKLPETSQRPREMPFFIKAIRPNFYRDDYDNILQRSQKACPAVRPKKEEMLEPAYCYTYVYLTWPKPKGHYPGYTLKKKSDVSSKNYRLNPVNRSK